MATCEFCYRQMPHEQTRDAGWDIVMGCYVCPDCQYRVRQDGGYAEVKGGAYTDGLDPREKKE